mgnify:CR=1 FL=1
MAKIQFGPGGTAGLGYEKGIPEIKRLGLDALEAEFTYGVRMSNEKAEEIGKLAKKYDISLSVHAPYYVNLASSEKEKIEASKKRIIDSCEKAYFLGAQFVVFHPAFYGKKTREEVYQEVKSAINEIQGIIKANKWNVTLAPETTGKVSQFGSLEELEKLSAETNCGICVDFAHVLARYGKRDYAKFIKLIKNIGQVTTHFSGINYGDKGEKNHVLTPEKDTIELLQNLIKHDLSLRIINESPEPINDSVKTKEIYKKLIQ